MRGEERVTGAGRVHLEGFAVRKVRNTSFAEAGEGKKEINTDVVNFVALIKGRLRRSYLMELREKSELIHRG